MQGHEIHMRGCELATVQQYFHRQTVADKFCNLLKHRYFEIVGGNENLDKLVDITNVLENQCPEGRSVSGLNIAEQECERLTADFVEIQATSLAL